MIQSISRHVVRGVMDASNYTRDVVRGVMDASNYIYDELKPVIQRIQNIAKGLMIGIASFARKIKFETYLKKCANFILCKPSQVKLYEATDYEEYSAKEPEAPYLDGGINRLQFLEEDPENRLVNAEYLEELREIVKRKKYQYIPIINEVSDQLRPEDFTQLCKEYPIEYIIREGQNEIERKTVQTSIEANNRLYELKKHHQNAVIQIEFPRERLVIGAIASQWAQQRNPKIDPNHKYYELFKALFAKRIQIEEGSISSRLMSTYQAPKDEQSYWSYNKFQYIVNTMIGFQELDREKHIELFDLLDNGNFMQINNPAYTFATKLSRIFTYPRAGGGTADIRYKLQNCLKAAWKAYVVARDTKCLPEFFNQFYKANCFDARVGICQDFLEKKLDQYFADCEPKYTHGSDKDTKIAAFWTAFVHRQILKYSKENQINYETLKADYNNDNAPEELMNRLKKTNFKQFLENESNPIRMPKASDGRALYNFMDYDPTKGFVTVERSVHHQDDLNVGDQIGLYDRNKRDWYKVRVHSVNPDNGKIVFDFRGEPVGINECWDLLQNLGLTD